VPYDKVLENSADITLDPGKNNEVTLDPAKFYIKWKYKDEQVAQYAK
jgi:hypothetical protein